MKTPRNRVLVIGAEKSRWKDRIVTKGGVELFLAPTSTVETYDVKYCGYVVGAPNTLTGYRKNDDEVRIKVGDKVYFHYNVMLRKNGNIMRVPIDTIIETNETDMVDVYECDYSEIFCRVDADGIHPIGDWVLLEKMEHTEQLGSGLLINPFSEVKKGEATVAHISPGVDLQTNDGPLAVGDTVGFKHDEGAFENEIEGKKYWCCPADIIFAKL